MGRVRGHAAAFGLVDCIAPALTVDEDCTMEDCTAAAQPAPATTMDTQCENQPYFMNAGMDASLAASAGQAANGSSVVIGTEDLRDTICTVLLVFQNSVNQTLSHNELRANVIGDGLGSKTRLQYQKCLLEISLMALVETGHLVRHGFGSWALYTAKPELWSGGAAGGGGSGGMHGAGSAGPDRNMMEKLLKVSRSMMAARLPVAGCRRQRSPLSPAACQPTKRRKGTAVAFV